MQLIAFVIMLMLTGNRNLAQFKPIIEELGGEEAAGALKQAEELSQMLNAVQALTTPPPEIKEEVAAPIPTPSPVFTKAHPLDPIKGIADDTIVNALSQYICLGE